MNHALSAPDALVYRSDRVGIDYPLLQKPHPGLLFLREAIGRSEWMSKIVERVAEHYDTQELLPKVRVNKMLALYNPHFRQ